VVSAFFDGGHGVSFPRPVFLPSLSLSRSWSARADHTRLALYYEISLPVFGYVSSFSPRHPLCLFFFEDCDAPLDLPCAVAPPTRPLLSPSFRFSAVLPGFHDDFTGAARPSFGLSSPQAGFFTCLRALLACAPSSSGTPPLVIFSRPLPFSLFRRSSPHVRSITSEGPHPSHRWRSRPFFFRFPPSPLPSLDSSPFSCAE